MEKEMNRPAGGEEIYSVYAEKRKEEMARIEMLEAQVEALRKSTEVKESSNRPEVIARIQKEIEALEQEIEAARYRAENYDADERSINNLLENTDSDKMPRA